MFDEWQEVSPLWAAVRFKVDMDNKKGKFLYFMVGNNYRILMNDILMYLINISKVKTLGFVNL